MKQSRIKRKEKWQLEDLLFSTCLVGFLLCLSPLREDGGRNYTGAVRDGCLKMCWGKEERDKESEADRWRGGGGVKA